MTMRTKRPLILASGSPRRKELLQQLGYEFEVVTRPIDESLPPDIPAKLAGEYLAKQKASVFADLRESHTVITADTVVIKSEQVLGKPCDGDEAKEMLRLLSGTWHEVVTGVCIAEEEFETFASVTRVQFTELEDREIDRYIAECKPFDKAGSYGIQEWIGMIGIKEIEGDYYNVVGLPVSELYKRLKRRTIWT